ncbi:hypothetical protein RI367_004534 [Sorochytrium milnesiophthora]
MPGQQGGFTACPQIEHPIRLDVKGDLPHWLQGTFYRIGPAKFTTLTPVATTNEPLSIEHWFDGFSLVHRFVITGDGRVLYNNCETGKDIETALLEGGDFPTMFGQHDPCKQIFKKVSAFMSRSIDLGLHGFSKRMAVNVTITPVRQPNLFLPAKQTEQSNEAKDSNKVQSLIARSDYHVFQRLDPVTLKPVQLHTPLLDDNAAAGRLSYSDINPAFRGVAAASHHQYDPDTQEHFNFTALPGPVSQYTLFAISPQHPHGRVVATIRHPHLSYVHSFALTKHYVVLILPPFYLKAMGAATFWYNSVIDASHWDESQPTIFHVIERATGKQIASYRTTEPLFHFHTVNAWEKVRSGEDDTVTDLIIDVAGYPNPNIVHHLYINDMQRNTHDLDPADAPSIRRYSLSSLDVFSECPAVLDPDDLYDTLPVTTYRDVSLPGADLPRINPTYAGHPTRFVYAVLVTNTHVASANPHRSIFNAIAKYDTRAKSHRLWSRPDHYPSEPVFIPHPTRGLRGVSPDHAEDAGVVLSVVLDGTTDRSYLLVLDAQSFTELARAQLPHHVPFGFHGSFAGSSSSAMDSVC